MSIFVIGINYKTAPIHLREKVYFAADKLALYLQDVTNRGLAQEAVLLSTCNRSELYCDADEIGVIRDWFCQQTAVDRSVLEPALYIYRNEEAVAHIMQVACGLDSMILGEPQILGQMKEAYSESCTAGTVGTLFHRLFQQVFTLAKDIRTTTAIGACPVSVASAAIHFVKQHSVTTLNTARIALIGAGDTTTLLMRYLQPLVSKPFILVNRSLEKAEQLAANVKADVYSLEKIEDALSQADIVFSATGSAIPLVNKRMVENIMQMRAERPMLLMDLAVPRDIDAMVAEVAHVQSYCIDDLKLLIEANRQGREHAAEKAREMVMKKSEAFIAEWQSFDKVTHAICAYRGQIESLCRQELLKAKQQLHQGEDAIKVLDNFAHVFVNKLLHAPSVQLRQAGAEGRFELLKFAKQLFSIPDPEVERR